MATPDFNALWLHYPDVSKPCDGRWANQCAIRMSVALNAEKTVTVSKTTYTEPKCAHGHARGAESLANWLYRKIGRPRMFKDGGTAKEKLASQSGIIFFKNCFTRAGEHRRIGDHIDLWKNGSVTPIGYDDPRNHAEAVWFWKL